MARAVASTQRGRGGVPAVAGLVAAARERPVRRSRRRQSMTTWFRSLVVSLVAVVSLAGCAERPAAPAPDAASAGAAATPLDLRLPPDAPIDACVPVVTRCPPRACGIVDDGCGVQLCCTGGCPGRLCQPDEP